MRVGELRLSCQACVSRARSVGVAALFANRLVSGHCVQAYMLVTLLFVRDSRKVCISEQFLKQLVACISWTLYNDDGMMMLIE